MLYYLKDQAGNQHVVKTVGHQENVSGISSTINVFHLIASRRVGEIDWHQGWNDHFIVANDQYVNRTEIFEVEYAPDLPQGYSWSKS